MREIRDSKYKKAESKDNNILERAVTKAADISMHMTLRKSTVENSRILRTTKNSWGCGKYHQGKDGSNFSDIQKDLRSADTQRYFAVGLYSYVELRGGPKEQYGGKRMRRFWE